MVCKAVSGFVALALASASCLSAELTDTELRWLQGSWPVVTYAKAAGIPLDVVVQPQDSPGAAPLALAFVAGRCKLVLSMRGNAEAEATLDRIAPDLLGATLELMAAHELGHCRRYLDGAWYDVPAGFAPHVPDGLDPALRAAYVDMSARRREEGYGDLVGLAWSQLRHPQQYARLQAWLVEERTRDRVAGSPHDTLAWVRLAEHGIASVDASPFAGPAALWLAGLADER
ncbi:MAG: hypothetical protein ABI460_09510 [Caldimonas sp.]